MNAKAHKRALWFWARAIIGLGLLCLLFFKVDWEAAWTTVNSANVVLFIAMVALFFPGVYISCVKWQLLLSVQKITAPLGKIFSIYLIGSFFSNFAPATIGSDVGRFYYTTQSTGKPAETATSIIVERATGILALIIWCLIASIVNYELARNIGLYTVLGVWILIIIVAIGGGYLIWRSPSTGKIKQMLAKAGSFKTMMRFAEKILHAFYSYRNAIGILTISMLLSLAFQMLGIFSHYLLFTALGLNVSFYQLMLLVPIINLASNIPLSISGWGIIEGAYVLLFRELGLTTEQALAAALLGRALLLIASLSGAGVLAGVKMGWLRIDWQSEKADEY